MCKLFILQSKCDKKGITCSSDYRGIKKNAKQKSKITNKMTKITVTAWIAVLNSKREQKKTHISINTNIQKTTFFHNKKHSVGLICAHKSTKAQFWIIVRTYQSTASVISLGMVLLFIFSFTILSEKWFFFSQIFRTISILQNFTNTN